MNKKFFCIALLVFFAFLSTAKNSAAENNFSNIFGEACSIGPSPVLASAIFFATCGNQICEPGEDRCDCATDCGECKGNVPNTLCEEYTCRTGLCRSTPIPQCCGNKICEAGENYSNCSRDCAPREVSIELVDYDSSKVFMRGDEATVKALVRGDGALVKGAGVTMQGFMGNVTMHDDGLNGDLEKNNGVYTAVFLVPSLTEKDTHTVKILATKEGAIEQIEFSIIVDPSLELTANFNKEKYVLGDIVDVNGIIAKRGEAVSTKIEFWAEFNGSRIFSETADSDENGFYKLFYHTSLIEGKGNWHFFVQGKDEKNNIGLVEKALLVTDAEGTAFLNIEFVSPTQEVFERRDTIRIVVNVVFDSQPVSSADVRASFLNNDSIKLTQFADGKYSGNYTIADNFSLGEQKIIVNATKKIDSISYTGTNSRQILVKEVPITIEVLSPDRSIFGLGESIDFRFRLSYASLDPVIGGKIDLKVNDEQVQVTEQSEGIYSASYALLDASKEEVTVSLNAEDVYSNTGSKQLVFEIQSSLSIDYYLRRYPLPFFSAIILLIAAAIIVVLFRRKKIALSSLEKRRNELLKLKKELQDKYFNQQSISNEEYYFLLDKYSSELRALESAIGAFSQKKTVKDEKTESPSIMEDDQPIQLFKIEKEKKEEPEQPVEEKKEQPKKENEKKKEKKKK